MIEFEDLKKYLPQYLSEESLKVLFKELDGFPNNFDKRVYTTRLNSERNIFQGDGISELPYLHLPSPEIKPLLAMVLSNTCDLDQTNNRLAQLRMVYAPIINLNKYENILLKEHVYTGKKTPESINSHISDIKNQYVSHIFFLPKGGTLEEDSIVFLDRVNNCPSNLIDSESIISRRLFTLSDYGFYVFLFKISIHFTRIREGVPRTAT